jgi:hypothetical protein
MGVLVLVVVDRFAVAVDMPVLVGVFVAVGVVMVVFAFHGALRLRVAEADP